MQHCYTCDGKGIVNWKGDPYNTCPTCLGKGKKNPPRQVLKHQQQGWPPCCKDLLDKTPDDWDCGECPSRDD